MQHIVTLLIAILIFGLIIGIHEFGHFIVAKLNHIQVNQFAIGMGPKILHFQKRGYRVLASPVSHWRFLRNGRGRSVQRQSQCL